MEDQMSLLDKIRNSEFYENITLPSLGKYYDDKMPNGIIEVRPMTAMDEKVLYNKRTKDEFSNIVKLISSCVRLPNELEMKDLTTGDLNFILFYLRGISYGDEFNFNIKWYEPANNIRVYMSDDEPIMGNIQLLLGMHL